MILHLRSRCSPGFTLIELVISATLMGIILVSGYLCLSSGVAGQKLVESRADVSQNARVALTMISTDLRSATPLSKDFEFLGMDRELEDIEADNLDFGTHNYLPRRTGEGDFCEVSYFVSRNEQTGVSSLWRRRDATPDTEPLAGGETQEITRGIVGLRFEYYDGLYWYDEWGDPAGKRKGQLLTLPPPNISGLPEAVRVTLWVENSRNTNDAPLVFQTVARLNLAPLYYNNSTATSIPGADQAVTAPEAGGSQ